MLVAGIGRRCAWRRPVAKGGQASEINVREPNWSTRKGGEMSDNEVDFSLLLGQGFPTRFFAKGETIFREGEPGDEFFVVVRGQVEIRSGNRCLGTLGRSGILAKWR
jgi:CRP-like cAMP-binding protein